MDWIITVSHYLPDEDCDALHSIYPQVESGRARHRAALKRHFVMFDPVMAQINAIEYNAVGSRKYLIQPKSSYRRRPDGVMTEYRLFSAAETTNFRLGVECDIERASKFPRFRGYGTALHSTRFTAPKGSDYQMVEIIGSYNKYVDCWSKLIPSCMLEFGADRKCKIKEDHREFLRDY